LFKRDCKNKIPKKKNKKLWFTLVELIVVITILSILWSIAFISLQWYSRNARDGQRISDISNIEKWLELWLSKQWILPEPEDKVDITASGTVITYQWYIWEKTLQKLWISNWGKDPVDDAYYTYVTNKSLNKYQILWYLENGTNLTLNNLINQTNAQTRDQKILYSKWSRLWVILDSTTQEPIQKTWTWIDILNTTNTYTAYLDNSGNWSITWTWWVLYTTVWNISCKRMKELWNNRDWTYLINPTWIWEIQVYCDMTTDWGWWTLVYKTTSNQIDLAWVLTLSEWSANWDSNDEYKLSIDYWKTLSTSNAMAKNVRIDWKTWNDIENWYIISIWIWWVSFSAVDIYKIFNLWTTWGVQGSCTSWTYYWNGACCARCVNYDASSVYWSPINSPMLSTSATSYTWSAIEWAWWTNDSTWHRLSKMWIFLK
jgi:prepilin-type N-terminal cleavage/methylation domain-containing protein